MFRAILYLIVSIVVISVIRSVVGMIAKVFASMISPGAPPTAGPGGATPTPGSAPEVLQKDPVCGTFVAPSTAWQKASGGKTYYFCSTHCRDQFKG